MYSRMTVVMNCAFTSACLRRSLLHQVPVSTFCEAFDRDLARRILRYTAAWSLCRAGECFLFTPESRTRFMSFWEMRKWSIWYPLLLRGFFHVLYSFLQKNVVGEHRVCSVQKSRSWSPAQLVCAFPNRPTTLGVSSSLPGALVPMEALASVAPIKISSFSFILRHDLSSS